MQSSKHSCPRLHACPLTPVTLHPRSVIRTSILLAVTCCWLMSVYSLLDCSRSSRMLVADNPSCRRWAITYLAQLHPLISACPLPPRRSPRDFNQADSPRMQQSRIERTCDRRKTVYTGTDRRGSLDTRSSRRCILYILSQLL